VAALVEIFQILGVGSEGVDESLLLADYEGHLAGDISAVLGAFNEDGVEVIAVGFDGVDESVQLVVLVLDQVFKFFSHFGLPVLHLHHLQLEVLVGDPCEGSGLWLLG
jgi:hypothetical protein